MKGSSRNKDHSTEGEGTGKRPKRKCLQWHPLLAKKLLDFSEEEEEEEEEEDIDKVDFMGLFDCKRLMVVRFSLTMFLFYLLLAVLFCEQTQPIKRSDSMPIRLQR